MSFVNSKNDVHPVDKAKLHNFNRMLTNVDLNENQALAFEGKFGNYKIVKDDATSYCLDGYYDGIGWDSFYGDSASRYDMYIILKKVIPTSWDEYQKHFRVYKRKL